MSSLGSGNKEEPHFKMAYSAKKKSAGTSDTVQFLLSSTKMLKQEKASAEILTSHPEDKSGITDEISSKGQKNSGSSGKRKHSRWDDPQADEQNVDDGVAMAKRRKTRWDDDSQLKMLGPMHLPDFVKGSTNASNDPEFQKLHQQLLDIQCKLNHLESINKLPREAPPCQKLIKEKQEIIRKLVRKNPTFDIPSDVEEQKLYKKLYIPVKEYPEYNFIGLIIGPRGRTQKRMEMETGARILLRGKGSCKHKDKKPDPSDDEDLHVLVEADSQGSLDAAVAMVEKLLVPVEDSENNLKHCQLKELAELRGGYAQVISDPSSKPPGTCKICGDAGHYTVACPLTAPLPVRKAGKSYFLCETCGEAGHLTVACPSAGKFLQTKTHENNVNLLPSLGDVSSLFVGPPFLRNQPLDFRPVANSMPFGNENSIRDGDPTNLYVAPLPQYVDVGRLSQLFSPFGALSNVKVIRDEATGLSKGYGFVNYVDPTSAAMAVNQMNGYRLDGKMLAVRVAGHPHGTPGSMQPVEHKSINFLPAYPSPAATTHIPAPTCLPGPLGSMLPETYGLVCASYGSSYSNPMPSSLTTTLNATSEEFARFPGNPDNFASGYPSMFS